MAAWDWDAYHAELLRRTRTVPPLMQSMRWNESANEADWLAPAQFPLPLYRLLRDEDGVPRRSLLSEHPCDPRDDNGMTAIALRQGIVEDIFRSSLIRSLVKQTPSERRRFFGMPITDIEHPRVGYIHWRDVPPRTQDPRTRINPLPLETLMTRSLARLGSSSIDSAACIKEPATDDEKLLPQTQEEHAAAFPQIIIFDGIGSAHFLHPHFGPLASSITVFADEYGMQRSEIIVLSDASDFGMDYIDSNTLYGYIDHRINVDAPATKQELQTFFLGWERWRNASGGPRALIRRANSSFERTLAAIEALGMRDPALAVNPGVHDDTNQSHHQATLDIACVIAAMQRDERPVATIAQLCDGFRERTTQKQRHELACSLWSFLKAHGFDRSVRAADECSVGEGFDMALDKPAALPFFFKSDTDLTTLHKDKLTSEEQFSLRGIMQRFKMHTSINPLLPSIFRSVLVVTNNKRRPALQLMNEPLALGFLAQDACHHLIEQTDGITEDMLGAYPKLMDQQAWATFVEQLFGALDEANAPMLARQVLHAVYPHCVKFNQDVVNTGIRKLREMGLNRFDGPSSTLWDRLKSALDSVEKVMQEGYADAVVRASLRHNLATGGTVPPAWAHWIGEPLLDDDFDGELWLPNKKEVAERVAFLRELLNEPIPACDNAALLLTYAGKLQTRASLQL